MWRRVVIASGAAVLLGALAVQTVGCSAMNSSPNRVLESMTLSPATADARNFTTGQVTFTATGIFSQQPSPAPVPFAVPYTGTWAISDQSIATINQSGVAACVPGASGTVTVTAIASTNSAIRGGQMSTAVSGTAKLTCP